MTLSTNSNAITFNKKKLRKILTESYRFVSNLEKYCNFPDQGQTEVSDDEREDRKFHKEETPSHDKQNKPIVDVKKRLRGLEEIEMKLKEIKGLKLKDIKNIRYKKNLKTRLNKQKKVAAFKQDKETKKQKKMLEKQKRGEALENKEGGEGTEENSNNEQKDKIIFNKDSKMVFNKIDFTGLGKEKNSKGKKGKVEKDPKQLLENVKKSNSEIKSLEASGEVVKAKKIKEKHMWVSALKRAEGVKVKDDVELLKKTVRKQTQLKNQRKKKWEARVHAVEKKKEDRQQKRTDNIAARKKEKKKNKIKKSVKKGRIVLTSRMKQVPGLGTRIIDIPEFPIPSTHFPR